MPNFRLVAGFGLVLLASQASWASFTKVSVGFSAACSATALGCSVTVSPPSTAGDVIIVYLLSPNGTDGIASITGGGTYTMCTACENRSPSGAFGGGLTTGSTIQVAYTLAAVGGASQLYLIRQVTSTAGWRIGYMEMRASTDHRPEFETGGARSTLATGTATPAGVTLALSGGETVLQLLTTDRGSVSVTAADNPTNPNWVFDKTPTSGGLFGVASNMSVLNSSFFWRLGSAGTLAASAIAFREVFNAVAPLLPLGSSVGSGHSVGFRSGIGLSGGPPGGAATLASIAITPATATVSNSGKALLFSVTGTWTDGTTSDVTPQCTWFDNIQRTSPNLGSFDPTYWPSDASWISTLPINCTNHTLCPPIVALGRGDPQLVHFSNNGVALVGCQVTHLGGPLRSVSTVQVGPLLINPIVGPLPNPTFGVNYSVSFTTSGGTGPYTYEDITPYPLHSQYFGLSFSGNTLSGNVPPGLEGVGPWNFALRVTDSTTPIPNRSTFLFTITFNQATAIPVTDNNYYDNPDGTCRNMPTANDGPAALPTKCFNTLLANTPSPGATFLVPNATYPTIQSALNAIGGAIPCGSTISIAVGTYDESLVYPAVSCNASHWITIKGSQSTSLPPEGTRVSPAWMNVASLPDRPPYNQPGTLGVYMPTIRADAFSQATLKFTPVPSISSPVPSYVRFSGLRLVQPGPGSAVCTGHNCVTGWQNTIVDTNCLASGGVVCPDHIIFDHVIAGPDDLTGNAIYLVCSAFHLTGTSMAIADSYIYGIAGAHGFCETHAIGFGNTDAANQGPYKIVNNYVEGGAENYITGGGHSVSTPADIQIRHNHMYKPENLWKPGAPGYLGTPMLIKNLAEFKNALRALIEGNIYEHSWYGHDASNIPFTDQFGYGVLLNSSSNLTDVHRPFVQDVTFRYNAVQHVVRGIQIDSEDCRSSSAVGCGIYPPGSTPTLIERISVHDNLFDDVSPKYFTQGILNSGIGNGFDGHGFTVINSLQSVPPVGILNSLTVNHNTVVSNSYRQNLIVASIAVSGTTATLTATTATPVVTPGQRLAVFGACTGFNDNNVTVLAVTQTTPVLIFTYTTTATGTCNQGFVSTLGNALGGSFNIHDGASDGLLVKVSETGTLAQVLADNFWLGSATRVGFRFCVAVGNPAGCTQAASFTVYGLTGNLVCYNTGQSTTTCPPNGTPATWTMAGTVACTGAGAGTVVGNATATACQTASQSIITWTHPLTGLPAANANARSYASYWLNPGPDPNPGWQNVVMTNNLISGRVQLTAGNCQNGLPSNTNQVLTLCGVVVTTGSGAYRFTCNLIAARQLTGQGNTADVLPLTNKGIVDFNSVGFVNYNSDNLGQGVTNFGDLALSSGSPYITGLPGCDGLPTGANVAQIQTYTAGGQ